MITIRFLAAVILGAALPVAGAIAAGVAAGYGYSLALAADGTVRSWGDDSSGALGVGRSLATSTPTPVVGISGVTAIAAGGAFTAALKADGTVWMWGSNDRGQLGDGSTVSKSIPVQVQGLTDVVQISAGVYHMMARRSDGSVWTWGANSFGELGDDGGDRSVPARVAGLFSVVEIAAGAYHSFARTSGGTVLGFGWDSDGQLGDGAPTEPYRGRFQPTPVVGLDNVAQLAGGGFHGVAVKVDGSVWAWGVNTGGQVGDGTTASPRATPTRVTSLASVVEVSAGYQYTAARKNDGTVWVWGDAGYGQLGDGGPYEPRTVPAQIAVSRVTQLAVGYLHSLALADDGGVWAWGANGAGELGDGTTLSRFTPSRVAGITGLSAVAVGGSHSVGLRRDGTVLTWGDNSWGQLGNGALTFRSVPSVVPGLAGITQVAAGGSVSLALTAQGTVYQWGNLIGYGVGVSTPALVEGLANVRFLSVGGYHVVAILDDGSLRAWGSNYRGRLGNGTQEGTLEPVVSNLTNVTRVSAGLSHTLAVRADGTVWAWGENDYGQLGDGSTQDRYSAVQVAGIANAVDVAAGPQHSLALLRDGTVMAWGRNYESQLGEGAEPMRLAPLRVPNLPAASAIQAGRDFSLAIAGGSVYAWGINYNGGIGCGACDGRDGPARLAGLERVTSLSSFGTHVLAMRDDGAVYAWGGNNLGQLGDGTLVDRDHPVVVLHEGGTGSVAAKNWFLDLVPAQPTQISDEDIPTFLVVASTAATRVVADIRYRAQDVGTTANTFVFALAPVTVVRGAKAKDLDPRFAMKARDASGKAGEVQCALAQLNAQGQLVAVSAASLQAYASGVLSAQSQSVNVLNAITPDVKGATFFVGYGPNGEAMLTNGTTRGVVSVTGDVSCKPQSPQTGWWFNPAEGGRGFSIEARGNRLFMAAFHYDPDGRATWNFSGGPTSLDGSLYSGDFLAASGGQTMTGAYRQPSLANAGKVSLLFSDATHGTIVWPGGTTPIERQASVPNGLALPPQPGVPEGGWWWNPDESGRGFFMEWQGGSVNIAGYMYDAQGRPTWYIAVVQTPNPLRITGNWWTFANGQALGQPYRPATLTSTSAGALDVQFTSAATATMTLPDGRRIGLVRQAF